MNGYLWLRLMRLSKKVRGTVEVSESLRGKLVKTMGEEASCCRTSCIYSGEENQSFSIDSSLKSKIACVKWGMSRCRLARTLVTSVIDQKVGKIDVKEERRTCSYLTSGAKRCFTTSSLHCRVNRESKILNKVLFAEFVDGE
ncbi:hypothetical protein Tco_0714766 [Tanacetum coccineum]